MIYGVPDANFSEDVEFDLMDHFPLFGMRIYFLNEANVESLQNDILATNEIVGYNVDGKEVFTWLKSFVESVAKHDLTRGKNGGTMTEFEAKPISVWAECSHDLVNRDYGELSRTMDKLCDLFYEGYFLKTEHDKDNVIFCVRLENASGEFIGTFAIAMPKFQTLFVFGFLHAVVKTKEVIAEKNVSPKDARFAFSTIMLNSTTQKLKCAFRDSDLTPIVDDELQKIFDNIIPFVPNFREEWFENVRDFNSKSANENPHSHAIKVVLGKKNEKFQWTGKANWVTFGNLVSGIQGTFCSQLSWTEYEQIFMRSSQDGHWLLEIYFSLKQRSATE